MPLDMVATWSARRSDPSSWRRLRHLTVLVAAVALLASLAAPTAADQSVVAESVAFTEGEMFGNSDADPIGFEAGRGMSGRADGFGAGEPREVALTIGFERDLDHPWAGSRCRGFDGTGTLMFFDVSGSVEREVTLHDAIIEFGDPNPFPVPFVVEGRWTDDTGATGLLTGSGYYFNSTSSSPDLGESGCVVESWFHYPEVSGEMTLLTDGESDDLVEIAPPGFASAQCELNGGPRIIDSTNQDLRTFVYVYQPNTDEVWLCAGVEDTSTGEGYGGRLEATPGDAGLSGGPGTPTTDSDSTACTTTTDPPNQVPGSHPISQGGVATVDYMVDAYANDDEAWVCLQVGSSDHRVVVPLGGSGTSFGTVATWYPDEGTPTP